MREVIEKNGVLGLREWSWRTLSRRWRDRLMPRMWWLTWDQPWKEFFAAHFGASVADQMFDNVVPMTPRIADCFKALHHISIQLFVVQDCIRIKFVVCLVHEIQSHNSILDYILVLFYLGNRTPPLCILLCHLVMISSWIILCDMRFNISFDLILILKF